MISFSATTSLVVRCIVTRRTMTRCVCITKANPTFTMATKSGHVARCVHGILLLLWVSKDVRALFIDYIKWLSLMFSTGTKGRHSNIRPVEDPKPQSVCEVSPPINNGDVIKETEPVDTFTPPDSALIEDIPVVESPNLSSAVPPQSITICKNCKAELSTIDPKSECYYHRGVQV